MSSYEYNDLIINAQLYGIYHMYTFDIVGSKKCQQLIDKMLK